MDVKMSTPFFMKGSTLFIKCYVVGIPPKGGRLSCMQKSPGGFNITPPMEQIFGLGIKLHNNRKSSGMLNHDNIE